MRVLLLVGSAAVAGCATPMTLREIQAVKPNCARIDRQIAACKRKRPRTIKGCLPASSPVAPALAALNIVAGTYGHNVAIATGDWAAAIDRKLAELKRAKKSC